MKTSISNIAWSADEDLEVYELLKEQSVSFLEIAPTRLWADPASLGKEEILEWKKDLEGKGLQVGSLQALLFGKPDLVLFGTNDARAGCLEHLKKMIDLASYLEAGPLVFGSPKNRLRGNLPLKQAMESAAGFFREIGDYASSRGCTMVIEANPAAYGCDFIQTLEEAALLVGLTDSPGFGLHLDSGELQMNQEDIEGFLARHGKNVRHVHISESMLAPVTEAHLVHRRLFAGLKACSYERLVVIEMKRQEPVLETIVRSLGVLQDLGRST